MKIHKLRIHDGVKYNCDRCDFKSTTQGNLGIHKLSVHEGVTYKCDQCDYRAKRPGNLKSHKLNIHKEKGVRYERDQ